MTYFEIIVEHFSRTSYSVLRFVDIISFSEGIVKSPEILLPCHRSGHDTAGLWLEM